MFPCFIVGLFPLGRPTLSLAKFESIAAKNQWIEFKSIYCFNVFLCRHWYNGGVEWKSTNCSFEDEGGVLSCFEDELDIVGEEEIDPNLRIDIGHIVDIVNPKKRLEDRYNLMEPSELDSKTLWWNFDMRMNECVIFAIVRMHKMLIVELCKWNWVELWCV